MSNQPAWARYGRLQDALVAASQDGGRTCGDRGAEVIAKWTAAGNFDDGGDVDGTLDAAERRAVRPDDYADGQQQPAAAEPSRAERVAHALHLAAAEGAGVLAEVARAVSADLPEVGRRFVLGGNAYLTLQGTDSRYTFRVAQGKPREGDSPDRSQPFFLSLLSGPDNTSDYVYVGIVDQSTGLVRLTRASRMREDSKPVAAWNWVMSRVFAGRPHAPATVHHAGRCGRCGRLLTVPSSIESGFGPECSGKLGI